MAIEAIKQVIPPMETIDRVEFENVNFLNAIRFDDADATIETQFGLYPISSKSRFGSVDRYEFTLTAYAEKTWLKCSQGLVSFTRGRSEDVFANSHALPRSRAFDHDRLSRICRASKSQMMLTSDQFYDDILSPIGTEYGSSFRVLKDIAYVKGGLACAKLSAREGSRSSVPKAKGASITTQTLDALIQFSFLVQSDGGKKSIPSMVPTHIERMRIDSAFSTSEPELELEAFVQSRSESLRTIRLDISAVNPSGQRPVILIEGLRTTFLTDNDERNLDETPERHLCCQIQRKPALQLMSTDALKQYCHDTAQQIDSSTDDRQLINKMIGCCIKEILLHLENTQNLEIRAHHQHYIDWIKRSSTARNHDPYDREGLGACDAKEDLLSRMVHGSHEARFFARVGKNLQKILFGDLDPLSLYSENDLLNDYLSSMYAHAQFSQPIKRYMELLTHANPRMSVLEIGAGAGAATTFCLHGLSSGSLDHENTTLWKLYDYTDISASHLSHAEENFAQYHGKMRFRTLDISADPVVQGYEKHSYDLIIAGYVSSPIRRSWRTCDRYSN